MKWKKYGSLNLKRNDVILSPSLEFNDKNHILIYNSLTKISQFHSHLKCVEFILEKYLFLF